MASFIAQRLFFSTEDEEFVSSFITSRSEKQLVQQVKRSLMSTKNYSAISINGVKKVVKRLRQSLTKNISSFILHYIQKQTAPLEITTAQ